MEPIISPWLIWAIQICNGIKGMFIAFSIVSGLSLIISFVVICLMISEGYDSDDNEVKLVERKRKISTIIFIPMLILSILVPNKDTATWMAVSSYVTEDNINTVANGTKEAINYIFDKIEGLTNETDNENKTESAS